MAVDANMNRGVKHGFLDMNSAGADPEGRAQRRARARIRMRSSARLAQADRDAADHAGPERLPAHGRADQRGPLLVSGRPLRRSIASHDAARPDGVVHALEVARIGSITGSRRRTARDPESDRGPTGADTPHNLVTSITWNLPGSGPILSGWRLSTVSHHQSGAPVYDPLRRVIRSATASV